MGKWINWMMWGITYPFLGAVLSAILTFIFINNLGTEWQPQLAPLGITPQAVEAAGIIGAIWFFVLTISFSIIFWLLAGVVSLITTPMLTRTKFGGNAELIFVPWLLLASVGILLNLGATAASSFSIANLMSVLTDFIISVIMNYIFIWISVWINKLFRMQKYLPA
ncbi:MAG: hypothetical protein PHY31_08515 [Smithellaceae bacterium]|nr:hypothetical protein [Smithellaceae bacterium]